MSNGARQNTHIYTHMHPHSAHFALLLLLCLHRVFSLIIGAHPYTCSFSLARARTHTHTHAQTPDRAPHTHNRGGNVSHIVVYRTNESRVQFNVSAVPFTYMNGQEVCLRGFFFAEAVAYT